MMFNNTLAHVKVERLLNYAFLSPELEQNKWNSGLNDLLKECNLNDVKQTIDLMCKTRSLVKLGKHLTTTLKTKDEEETIAYINKINSTATHVQGFIASLLEMKVDMTKHLKKGYFSHSLEKNLTQLQTIFNKIASQFKVLEMGNYQPKARFSEILQSHLIVPIYALKERSIELGRRIDNIVKIMDNLVKNPQGLVLTFQELEQATGHYYLSKNIQKIIQRLKGQGQENSRQAQQYENFLQDYILQVFRIIFSNKHNLDISSRQEMSSFLEAEKSNLLTQLRSLKSIQIIYNQMKNQEKIFSHSIQTESTSKISGNLFKLQDEKACLMSKLKEKQAWISSMAKQNDKIKQEMQQLIKERESMCKKIEKLEISYKLNKNSIQISESTSQLYQSAQQTITQLTQKNRVIKKSLEEMCKPCHDNCQDEMSMISHIKGLISTLGKENQNCKQATSLYSAEKEKLKIDCLNANTLLENFKNESANDQKKWLNHKKELDKQLDLLKRKLQQERRANQESKSGIQKQLSKSKQDYEQLKAHYQQQQSSHQGTLQIQENTKLQAKVIEANRNTAHNEKISQLEEKCSHLYSQNKLCRQKFQRLEVGFKLLEKENIACKQEQSKTEQLNQGLQAQLKEKNRLLALQQVKTEHLSQQNSILSKDLKTHQSNLDEKEKYIGQLLRKTQQITIKNQLLAKQIKTLEDKQKSIQELRQEQAKLLSMITLLNERQSRSNQTISQLKIQVANANKKIKNFQEDHDILQDDFKAKNAQIEIMGYKMEQARQELKGSYEDKIFELGQRLQSQRQSSKNYQIERTNNANQMIEKCREVQQQRRLLQELRKEVLQKDQCLRKMKEQSSAIRKISDISKVPLEMKEQVRKKIEQQYESSIMQLRKRYITLYQQKYSNFHNKSLQDLDSVTLMYIEQLFCHELLQTRIDLKFRILTHLFSFNNKTVTKTKLIFEFDPQNPTNFHKYIDGKPNLICIVKTVMGAFVAGYYSGVYEQSTMTQPGLLISLTNNDSYELYPSQNRANGRTMVYDPYFLIFGNAQFRIRSGEKNIFCNFGIMNSYFNHRNKKVHDFLCAGNERETEMESYEIYEIVFHDEDEDERQRELAYRQ